MNTMPAPAVVLPAGSYETTRFNALRHGVLSRYTVLPWEDEAEYRALLGALVAEHAPVGPTEEHLVEEIAGVIWRKRRLRMAEAAIFREELRSDADADYRANCIAGAALLPITGKSEAKADTSRAIAAAPADTARELREVKRDQGMTLQAWNILEAGGAEAYQNALSALRNDTRAAWHECLDDPPDKLRSYKPTAEALMSWIDRNWMEWYERPIAELEHRDAIRNQALGAAYGTRGLDAPARYEVHLDRKLERTLAMLVRLRELRQAAGAE